MRYYAATRLLIADIAAYYVDFTPRFSYATLRHYFRASAAMPPAAMMPFADTPAPAPCRLRYAMLRRHAASFFSYAAGVYMLRSFHEERCLLMTV